MQKKIPVISILGHVDSGKTTLIEALTGKKILEKGGITQNIHIYEKDKYVLLDTPGHEVFSFLRRVVVENSDIIILIIALDQGIQPQTKEILNLIETYKKEVIICFNKVDIKTNEKLIYDLAGLGFVVDAIGGDILQVSISAKKKIGLKELEDTIDILAETLEIIHQKHGKILNYEQKNGVGIEATILIRDEVKLHDDFWCGSQKGKVRTLIGQGIIKKISGFSSEPFINSDFSLTPLKIENINQEKFSYNENQKYNFILKAKTQLELETMITYIKRYGNILSASIGELQGSQLDSNIIYIFWYKPSSKIIKLLDTYHYIYGDIIYDILDQLDKLTATTKDKELINIGNALVTKIFFYDNKYHIGGSFVQNGYLKVGNICEIHRNNEKIFQSKIKSLKQQQKSVTQSNKNTECGVLIEEKEFTFQVNDQIICFE